MPVMFLVGNRVIAPRIAVEFGIARFDSGIFGDGLNESWRMTVMNSQVIGWLFVASRIFSAQQLVDIVGGFAEGNANAAFDFERRDQGSWRLGLGFALVAFFSERDAAFRHDHAAFGEGKGAEAGDDLKQRTQFGRAGIGTRSEFQQAKLKLVFGELQEIRGLDAGGGDVFSARFSVFGDLVAGVETAERARAQLDAELFLRLETGFLVGGTFFAKCDEGLDLFGREIFENWFHRCATVKS
jgi:hypothetical protein